MLINEQYHTEIPANAAGMLKAERFTDEICDYFNVSNDYYANILVAVTEAVQNAIVHGCNGDKEKSILLSFSAANGAFTFTIKDPGQGFIPEQIGDPTDPQNTETEKGRGLYLMKSLADSISFEENGTRISLSFNIASINNSHATRRMQEFLSYQAAVKNKTNHNVQ